MILTDTHCHLDLEHFDTDREAVIRRALQEGIEDILIPGLSLISSRSVIKLAAAASGHPRLHAAVGVHPTEAGTWDELTHAELKALIDTPAAALSNDPELTLPGDFKVAAIGEIGLDYYWQTAAHEVQQRILKEQLDLAAETNLPVLIHMREAKDAPAGPCAADLLSILREWVSGMKDKGNLLAERPGVLHSFAGSLEMAREAIELGFYIGVSGSVTFTNAKRRQEIVSQLPLERLLTETDSPFLTPHPHRGQRNEPAYVRLIADKIALLQRTTVENVAETTRGNARRLFLWKHTA